MKKNLFGWVVMAAMLVGTGCSSDEVVENFSPENAIEFSTYVGRDAESRGSVISTSGDEAKGELSLEDLGFGVFAYYTDESDYVTTSSPCNFMYNEQVTKKENATDWGYSPVKYWPNDVNDKLTFFAYAPHDDADDSAEDGKYDNITFNAQANMKGDPIITFTVNNEVKKQTDLLVNRTPHTNITKNKAGDDGIYVDEKVTFNFAHALSRIGFTVKAITDEVVSGDTPIKLDAATTIVLREVRLVGAAGQENTAPSTPIFYTKGELNLNQTAVTPTTSNDVTTSTGVIWTNIVGDDANDGKQYFTLNNDDFVTQTSETENIYDTQGFILTENTDILTTGNSTSANPLNTNDSYIMIIPQEFGNYSDDDQNNNGQLYVYAEYDVITIDKKLNGGDTYDQLSSKVTNHISTPIQIKFESGKAYTLNLQLGMTSVKVDASVDTWSEGNKPVDLPVNTEEEKN